MRKKGSLRTTKSARHGSRTNNILTLARKTLFEDMPRFFVALGGIVFAVTLLTVQVALFTGFANSTALPISESPADIWVTAPEMLYFEGTLPLEYADVAKVRAVPG